MILATTLPGDVVLDPFFGTGTTGAVAKQLGRRWVGIGRDARYAAAARQRIDRVQPEAPSDELGPAVEVWRLARVPFASLVADGRVPPGTLLHFDRRPECAAVVLADGRTRLGEHVGSMHQVGRIAGGLRACNGWEHWWAKTPAGGFVLLDSLRQEYRSRRLGP